MKKYRLKIKWPIAENELNLALFIRQNDEENTIIDSSRIDNFYKGTGVPESWLTEIKEPLSFEEWDRINYIESTDPQDTTLRQCKINKNNRDHRKIGWSACLENQKPAHEPDHLEDTENFLRAQVNYEKCDLYPGAHTHQMRAWFWNAALAYARGQMTNKDDNTIIVKQKNCEDDNKFLQDFFIENKITEGDNIRIHTKMGLTPHSVTDEIVPIDKNDLCKLFQAALAYARGQS